MPITKYFDYFSWKNVGNGANWQFRIKPGQAILAANARVLSKDSNGNVTEQTHKLSNNNLNVTIQAGWSYQVRVWILFKNEDPQMAKVRARIRDANGRLLPKMFRNEQTGQADEVWRLAFEIKE